jgi:integrase
MAQVKLTKKAVDAIAHPTQGQEYYSDIELKGFGLRVGLVTKTYFVEKRIKGRSVRVTVGKHGEITPTQARDEAKKKLGEMSRGVDPNVKKRGERSKGITLEKAFEDFLRVRTLKPRTIKDYKKAMNTYLSDWKKKKVIDIHRDMVSSRHQKIKNDALKNYLAKCRKKKIVPDKKKKESVGNAQSNQTMRFLRSLFNFCEGEYQNTDGKSLIEDNPVAKLSKTKAWHRVTRRKTSIENYDLPVWYKAVKSLENGVCRDYLLLTLFTGLRKNEGLALQTDSVDLKGRTFTVVDPKNREDLVLPLSDYLYKLLKVRIESNGDSKYIFPSIRKPGMHLVEPKKQVEKVVKESGVKFCIHDLRRVFTTVAESLDLSLYTIKTLVNHSTGADGDVTAGYVMARVERLRLPVQEITSRMLDLVKLKI